MAEYAGLEAEFRERFRVVTDPAMVRAERRVTGGDYGATSYTTIAQADDLARRLQLGPGKALLDIGSGAGWPANYLAKSTGCTAVLTDPTWEGMAVAVQRSRQDGIRSAAVVADGSDLPLRDLTFDACSSSDVFC
ncbi:MAG TPA: methyltransferase domain-containing protein [Acidimicrobiia bacterium]